MTRLLRDPIARIALALWAGTAAVYFVPGVPADFLVRMGDRYNTLPLWAWAAAGCIYGVAAVGDRSERRFWWLQAVSFWALLAIEVPWALANGNNSASWNVASECCYFVYYLCQLLSVARTRSARAAAIGVPVAVAAALSLMAVRGSALYDGAWPSYLSYLAFDLTMAIVFWRMRSGADARWSGIYTGLAITALLVFGTDVLDMLWYVGWITMDSGTKADLLWTLPPLGYALVSRFGREG